MVKIMALGNGMNVCYGGNPTEAEMKEFVIALATVQNWCDEQIESAIAQMPLELQGLAYEAYQHKLEEQNQVMQGLAQRINQEISQQI